MLPPKEAMLMAPPLALILSMLALPVPPVGVLIVMATALPQLAD